MEHRGVLVGRGPTHPSAFPEAEADYDDFPTKKKITVDWISSLIQRSSLAPTNWQVHTAPYQRVYHELLLKLVRLYIITEIKFGFQSVDLFTENSEFN